MIETKCENCEFFLGIDEKTGSCKRYPPYASAQLIPKGTSGVIGGPNRMELQQVETVTWPRVRREDWCGEFNNGKS